MIQFDTVDATTANVIADGRYNETEENMEDEIDCLGPSPLLLLLSLICEYAFCMSANKISAYLFRF